jgi:hypothetical protein
MGLYPRVALIVPMLAGLALGTPHCAAQAAAAPGAGETRLRVTSQVVLPGVTRLGINLGAQYFYDSGQMMKNLLYRNPGFEGMSYRSILHCDAGGAASCLDRQPGTKYATDFFNGASYEVLDGAAAGRRGTVVSSTREETGYRLSLDGQGKPIGAGDWVAVQKEFPGDPTAGWWPNVSGGAQLKAERADLSPATPGRQALRVLAAGPGQSAQIKSYFDSTEGYSFIHLRGRYRLSFKAKFITGFKLLHIHVARLGMGRYPYLEQDVHIGPSWEEYHQEFTANEADGLKGTVEVSFNISGSEMLLDDVDLEQVSGDPANHTAFRDEVIQTLKVLHPGVLRMMNTNAGMGSTIDDLLAPPLARQRAGFSAWWIAQDDIPYGIPEFLDLCKEVDAEPWLAIPTAMSKEEARKLAEYLAGGPQTKGGALRAAGGHAVPWTQVFPLIHIELGNEAWNGSYQGETINDPPAYGRRANTIFAVLRAAAGPDAARFDLVVGAQADWPDRDGSLLAAAPLANTMAIAPYLMHKVTRWATDDELYGALLAQPEQMSREGIVQKAHALAGGRQMAVYEVNLHTTDGAAPQAVLDRFTPSTAAGVAVAGHMLRMMRDHGIRDQMIYSLPQFIYKRGDGTPVKLWGTVVEMGSDGRKRPQFLAASLANRVIRGNMIRVELTGDNPVHDQPEGNDGVHLKGVHELDAYAFQDGKSHGLILFNYGLHQGRRVSLEAPGLSTHAKVFRLASPGPGATNEAAAQVRIEEEKYEGAEMVLPPCTMTVIEWFEEK